MNGMKNKKKYILLLLLTIVVAFIGITQLQKAQEMARIKKINP